MGCGGLRRRGCRCCHRAPRWGRIDENVVLRSCCVRTTRVTIERSDGSRAAHGALTSLPAGGIMLEIPHTLEKPMAGVIVTIQVKKGMDEAFKSDMKAM